MKKLGIIAMALALLVVMSQCKKENANTSTNEGAKVNITLNVNGGYSSRVAVNTENGEVTFENGDVLYVASDGVYVGTLTYNGTNFSGNISEPTEEEKLHFYFLGNVDTEETLTEGTSTGCSVVISDQTTKLPVISYAPSREDYQVGKTDYNATLLNKCALVKFDVTTSSETATCITGMKNKVTVSFAENTLTHSQEGNGVITLPAGNGEKWAILLPNEALEPGEQGSAFSQDGVYIGTRDAVPTITENDYLTTGIAVTVNMNAGFVVPEGAISGKFTINSNDDQVYFSQGNLQYIGSAATPYWKFADNQWDYLGTTTGQNSSDQNVDRDLFGWGTSGWNNGNMYYQPYNTESNYDGNTGYGYGPTNGTNYTYNLTGTYANADWGVYNAISNGGNTPNQWRTLTNNEWSYVINSRSTPSGIRYAKGIVNSVKGIILLPDDWNASIYALNYPNMSDVSCSTNEIDAESWVTIEAAGAVFLPTAGYRSGTSVYYEGYEGHYWSVSYSNSYYAKDLYFGNRNIGMNSGFPRSCGFSVRLVYEN